LERFAGADFLARFATVRRLAFARGSARFLGRAACLFAAAFLEAGLDATFLAAGFRTGAFFAAVLFVAGFAADFLPARVPTDAFFAVVFFAAVSFAADFLEAAGLRAVVATPSGR
jgi:hypothetical protein